MVRRHRKGNLALPLGRTGSDRRRGRDNKDDLVEGAREQKAHSFKVASKGGEGGEGKKTRSVRLVTGEGAGVKSGR